MIQPHNSLRANSSNPSNDDNADHDKEDSKWATNSNSKGEGSSSVEVQQQLQETRKQLEKERESKALLEEKVLALESQTPVMKKLTSFVSTQRALEKENRALKEQLREGTTTSSNNSINVNDNGGFTEEEVNKLLDEEQEKHTQELQALREAHSVKLNALQQELGALKGKQDEKATTDTTDTSTNAEVLQLQAELQAVRQGHATEMDEILQQLDLVEAEQKDELQRVQTFADEQQAMVTALSHELANKTNTSNNNNYSQDQWHQVQQELNTVQANAQHWQDRCQEIRTHYEQLLEEEQQHTLQEADKARQETIQEAEAQFQQANQMYISLKQEYVKSQQQKQVLEQELDATQEELEHWQAQLQSMEQQNFPQQLEELQQELERVQSVAVHDKQHFTEELNRFQQSYDAVVEELEQTNHKYQALEKTHATTLQQKEQLVQENTDLKGVCEETMALLEQYQNQQGDTQQDGGQLYSSQMELGQTTEC